MHNDDLDLRNLYMRRKPDATHDSVSEALKNNKIKLVAGEQWMVWDGEWKVWHRKWNGKKTRLLVSTTDESEAVKVLLS